jgi:hypothetical protein
VKHSEQIAEIAVAMSKAQAAMRPAHKDSENPHFKSRYADLAAVWDALRAPLTDNGLIVLQDVETSTGTVLAVLVTTRIVHTSGQWFEFGPLAVPMAKADAHGVGSATTYGRRFSLSAALGVVADEDDDGNKATEPEKPKSRRQAPEPPAPKPIEPVSGPTGPAISDEQVTSVYASAKSVGITTPAALAPVLQRIVGVQRAVKIPADKYEFVLEQLALEVAP